VGETSGGVMMILPITQKCWNDDFFNKGGTEETGRA